MLAKQARIVSPASASAASSPSRVGVDEAFGGAGGCGGGTGIGAGASSDEDSLAPSVSGSVAVSVAASAGAGGGCGGGFGFSFGSNGTLKLSGAQAQAQVGGASDRATGISQAQVQAASTKRREDGKEFSFWEWLEQVLVLIASNSNEICKLWMHGYAYGLLRVHYLYKESKSCWEYGLLLLFTFTFMRHSIPVLVGYSTVSCLTVT